MRLCLSRRGFAAGAALLGLLAMEQSAFAGAWPVTHKWNEKARPDDPTSGSYAYEYGRESVAMATSETAAGTPLDCADFAITLLCEYAAKNGLEVVWTMYDPAKQGKLGKVSSTEARFTSPRQFAKWSRDWINAQMVAQHNTSPITYDAWRGGDVVMMRWNQLGDMNPFPGRDVWHTYFTGEANKLLFYGNIEGEDGPNPTPLPIVATTESRRLQEVRSSAAVYQASPRRWNIIKDAIVPPERPLNDVPSVLAPKEATVTATALNVRNLPSTHSKVLTTVKKGEKLVYEGKTQDGNWVRVRRSNGEVAYVSAQYVTVADAKPGFPIEKDWVPPSNTNGFNGAFGNDP